MIESETETGLVLEQLIVRGSAQAMGEQHGEHFREKIHSFIESRREYLTSWVSARGGDPSAGALALGARSMAVAAAWDAEGHAEHLGIARGAGVDPAELYTAANLTDLRDVLLYGAPGEDEGCTSLLVPAPWSATGEALAGQTWDLHHRDVEHIVAIGREPAAGPRTWSVTCAGCLTLMAITEEGLALGTTNIKARGGAPGVGYLSVLHRAARASTLDEASTLVAEAPRAGAHTYWLADAARQIEWETVPGAQVVREALAAPLHRTNHCLYSPFMALEAEPPSASSLARYRRMEALLGGAGSGAISVEHLKAIFADRADGPLSVNRYPEDGQPVATNAVFIAVPARREAWACRGTADRGRWVRLGF